MKLILCYLQTCLFYVYATYHSVYTIYSICYRPSICLYPTCILPIAYLYPTSRIFPSDLMYYRRHTCMLHTDCNHHPYPQICWGCAMHRLSEAMGWTPLWVKGTLPSGGTRERTHDAFASATSWEQGEFLLSKRCYSFVFQSVFMFAVLGAVAFYPMFRLVWCSFVHMRCSNRIQEVGHCLWEVYHDMPFSKRRITLEDMLKYT